MKFKKPFYYLVEAFSTPLNFWTSLDVVGADREKFFQGQLTQDILSQDFNSGKLTARINRQGQVQFFCYLIRFSDSLKILIPQNKAQSFKDEMNKFIIMDDVEIVDNSKKYYLNFNSEIQSAGDAALKFYGLNAILSEMSFHEQVPLEELELFRRMSFFPRENSEDYLGNIINDTILNEYAISYKKGCFLGQETVAKIENNRGAAYYPVVFKLHNSPSQSLSHLSFQVEGRKGGVFGERFEWNDDSYIQATLFRDFRVQGRKLNLEVANEKISVEVQLAPFLKNSSAEEYLELLKDLNQFLFLKHQEMDAIHLLEKASVLYPNDAEILEMYGALLGRLSRYEEAIQAFDKLEQVDPSSVMAHTNKSLFYMKLGQIEKAEDEKSKATVKSFAKNADEAKLKKLQAEEVEKKKQEIKKRESMFLRVLEIDPEDTVANQGLGDVYFQEGQFEKALHHLELALGQDEKLSVSYLIAGKCFEALGKKLEALKVYEAGIVVASKQGDMMPANEMQSRLNQLK